MQIAECGIISIFCIPHPEIRNYTLSFNLGTIEKSTKEKI